MRKTTAIKITSLTMLLMVSATLPGHSAPKFASVVLYNGAMKTDKISPEQQDWLTFIGKAISRQSSKGVTHLVTSPSAPAGYSNYSLIHRSLVNPFFPKLDRAQGFTIQFEVKLNNEDHQDSDKNGDRIGDRSGFSVLVISNDQKGVELGFWKTDANPRIRDRIWVQQDGMVEPPKGNLFTHTAEGAAFDTSKLTYYELHIQGDRYQLFANRSTQPILTGALRDYTAFDYTAQTPPLAYSPYATPNFLFFGDDTSSASADVELTWLAVNTVK